MAYIAYIHSYIHVLLFMYDLHLICCFMALYTVSLCCFVSRCKCLCTNNCRFAATFILVLMSHLLWSPYCWLKVGQYPEGPATGRLGTGFAWFPSVYTRMLRWFPRLQVATACFSCSPPCLN